jgi:hypothetical protein
MRHVCSSGEGDIRLLWGNGREINQLEDLGADGRITSKCTLKNKSVVMDYNDMTQDMYRVGQKPLDD